jgi:hypothetical protein
MSAMAFTPRVRETNSDPSYTPDVFDCVIERITFHNEENGYSVVKVVPADAKDRNKVDVIPVIGNFPIKPVEGETLRVFGRWDKHPQHGKQFRMERYETLRPATAAAIEKYLGSGMVKGIGPKAAQWMVKKFGDQTLDIIETEPMRLMEVKGIGEKKVVMIQKAWEEQREVRNIMLFLQGHGITPTYAVKIYRYYKDRAIEQVEKNPYQLATDIWGIGFKSADKIARNLGVAYDAPQRLEAGLVYVLNQEMESGGHCFLPMRELIDQATENLYIASAEDLEEPIKISEKSELGRKIEPMLGDLVARGLLNAETIEFMGIQETAIYTPSFHTTEKAVAERINQLIASPWRNRPKPNEIDAILAAIPDAKKLSEEQEMAVRRAMSESLLVLTGGPGTGKCVVGDTLVLGRSGFQRMRDYWGAAPEIPDTFNECSVEILSKDGLATTSHAYYGGVRETRRVKTHLGLEIEGTPNHRVWAMTEHGPNWKRLDEMRTGDHVAVRRGDNVWGDGDLHPDVGYLFGVLLGDGGLTQPRSVCITNNDIDLLNRCNQIFRDHFGYSGRIHSTRKTFELRVHGVGLWKLLENLGITRSKSEQKYVPQSILSACKDTVRQFLAGLIDTSGYLEKYSENQACFEITLKSQRLIREIQLLCLNLGIVGRWAPKTTKYRYQDRPIEERTYWRYQTYGSDTERLVQLIPTQKAFLITERTYNTNTDVVPLPGLTSSEGITDEIAALDEACRPEFFWDMVEHLEVREAPVYDLAVPGPESFVANGLVHHNTTTTNVVIQALEKLGRRIQIAAPTGRAAKNSMF